MLLNDLGYIDISANRSIMGPILPDNVTLTRRNLPGAIASFVGDIIHGVQSKVEQKHDEPTQTQHIAQPPPQTTKPTEPHNTPPPSPTPVFITITKSQAPTITEPSSKLQSGGPPRTSSTSNAEISAVPDQHIAGGGADPNLSIITITSSQASPMVIGGATPLLISTITATDSGHPQASENSPSPSPQAATQTSLKHGQPIAVAIGVGIGIFFILLLLASAILFFIRRARRRRQLRRKQDEEGSFKNRWSYHGSTWSGSEVTGATGDVYFPTTVASSSVRSPRRYSDIFSMAATSMTQQSYHGSKSKVNR